jgi:hypothetical protein
MSLANDNVEIILQPEKVTLTLQDSNQLFVVKAESITLNIGSVLSSTAEVRVIGEQPTGLINNQNTVFQTLSAFVPLSTEVILNGTIQTYGQDYVTTGTNTITMNSSLQIGDTIRVNYTLG